LGDFKDKRDFPTPPAFRVEELAFPDLELSMDDASYLFSDVLAGSADQAKGLVCKPAPFAGPASEKSPELFRLDLSMRLEPNTAEEVREPTAVSLSQQTLRYWPANVREVRVRHSCRRPASTS
jgi:hypothetical protein